MKLYRCLGCSWEGGATYNIDYCPSCQSTKLVSVEISKGYRITDSEAVMSLEETFARCALSDTAIQRLYQLVKRGEIDVQTAAASAIAALSLQKRELQDQLTRLYEECKCRP